MKKFLLCLNVSWLVALSFASPILHAAMDLVPTGFLIPSSSGDVGEGIAVTENQAMMLRASTVQFFDKRESGWVPNGSFSTSDPDRGTTATAGRGMALSENYAAFRRLFQRDANFELLLYRRTEGTWFADGRLVPEASTKGVYVFGEGIAMEGGMMLISQWSTTLKPRVVCYQRAQQGNSWELVQTIEDPSGQNTGFGASIAIKGPNLIIGATEFRKGGKSVGCALAYQLINGKWKFQSTLRVPNPSNKPQVELRVALAEGRVALTAQTPDSQPKF